MGFHELQAPAPAGLVLQNDVEEDAVAVGKEPHRLANLLAEVIQIRTVKIHKVITRVKGSRSTTDALSVFISFPPVWMHFGRHLVEPRGKINRRVDADFLGGVVLHPQQIEVEMRMDFADARRVIAQAVMALGKKRDRIDGCGLQRFLPTLFVESFSDAGNIG